MMIINLPRIRLPNGGLGPDLSALPPGAIAGPASYLGNDQYEVPIIGPPELVAADLLETNTDPVILAVKALLNPVVEQTNAVAERAGHKDLSLDLNQVAESAKLALEKGQGGDKDPGPGDGGGIITPPKEGGVTLG